MSKVLVTGATGALGKGVIEFLLKKGIAQNQISALVRNESKAADLKEKNLNIVIGDYNDYASLVSAFKGVDKLLFVSSSDIPNRVSQHQNVVKAAKEAVVGHVIYTSGLLSIPAEKSAVKLMVQAHESTEQWLRDSGLTYTFLRNSIYLDFIPQFIGGKVLETSKIYLPAADGKTSFTLRSDIAEAAANVLATEVHEGKAYNITNLEAYTYKDVADAISEITGKTITYVSPTLGEFQQTLKGASVSEEFIGAIIGLAVAQARGEFDTPGTDLEKLLGRKPTTLKQYLKTIYGNS